MIPKKWVSKICFKSFIKVGTNHEPMICDRFSCSSLAFILFCFYFFFLFGIELFTNRFHCLAFFARSVQSSLVASICMSPESRTSHSKGALQSNQSRHIHHNVWIFGRYLVAVDQPIHRWPMKRQLSSVDIVDSFGSLEWVAPMCLSSLIHYSHLDRKFQRQAY